MNTVVVDGVPYTKAKEVSRKYHYTTDYLGQLCRAGKIECQLVGRAWYINEKSVSSHKNNESLVTRHDEITSVTNHISTSAQLVSPRPRKHTVAAVPTSFLQKLTRTPGVEQPPYYQVDDSDLIPQPIAKAPLQPPRSSSEPAPDLMRPTPRIRLITPTIPVLTEVPIAPERENLEDESSVVLSPPKGTKISIRGNKKSHKIAFTKAPAVSLTGTVKITPLQEPKFIDDTTTLLEEAERTPIRTMSAVTSSSRLSPRAAQPRTPVKQKEFAALQFLPQSVSPKRVGRVSVEGVLLAVFLVVSASFTGAAVFLKTEVTVTPDQVVHRMLIQLPY